MGLTLVTPASSSPVSLAEAKAWCRVDGTAEDSLIQMLIDAAIGAAADFTGKALAEQSWALSLDDFTDEMELPRGPVIAISEIAYLDENDVSQILDTSVYLTDIVSEPQRVVRNPDASWPAVSDRVNAVTITFTTGYAALPQQIRASVLMMVAHWYDSRTAGAMPDAARQLLWPFRRLSI